MVALKNSMGSATWPVDGHASSTMPSISGAPSDSERTTSLRTYRVRGWSSAGDRRLGAVPPGDPLAVAEALGPVDEGHGQHAGRPLAVGPVAGRGVRGGPVVVVERLDHQVGRPCGGPSSASAGLASTAPVLVAVQPHRHLGHMGVLALGRPGPATGPAAASASWTLTATAPAPRRPGGRARSRRAAGPAGTSPASGSPSPHSRIDRPSPSIVARSGQRGPGAGTRQAPSMSKTWLKRPRASHEPTHRARSTSSSSL